MGQVQLFGGLSLALLVSLVGLPIEAEAQSSQPASAPAGRVDVGQLRGQLTLIVEIDENHLKVQESWQIQNPTRGAVPAEALVFELGPGIRRPTLDEDVMGFTLREGESVVRATGPLGPGNHTFALSYLLDHSGRAAHFNRTLPVPVQAGRLIVEDVSSLEAQSPLSLSSRSRDLNGLTFRIFDYGNLNAGQRFDVRLTGLPSRAAWPRWIAVLLCVGAFVWMVVAVLQSPPEASRKMAGALSASARRDQLLRALELLEEDRARADGAPEKYQRRREALVSELADVLRELELARGEGAAEA